MSDQGPSPLDYASSRDTRGARNWPVVVTHWLVIGGIVLVVIAILLPPRRHPPRYRVQCMSNLRQLGLAALQYAGNHNRAYPDSWETLILNSNLKEQVFLCAEQRDPAPNCSTPKQLAQKLSALGRPDAYATASKRPPMHLAYIYCGKGLTTKDRGPSKLVLAYEPLCDHKGNFMNVLFADGHVESMPPATVLKLINCVPSAQTAPANER